MGGDLCEVGIEMKRSSQIKKKGVIFLLIGIILLVWYFALFGEKGVIKIVQLKRQLNRIVNDTSQMREENKRLREEIRRLREDPRYLESVARRDLGLIKENEVLFIFENERVEKEGSED